MIIGKQGCIFSLAYKKLDKKEYSAWNEEFTKAKASIDDDRDVMLERLSDMMEKDLILVGFTAVEDKLQKGVPQRIDKLAQAGLKIRVLTGDKMETAINIGLLRQAMRQICIATMNAGSVERSSERVTRFIKEETGKTTLAMGDGASDVGMIQEADIGVRH